MSPAAPHAGTQALAPIVIGPADGPGMRVTATIVGDPAHAVLRLAALVPSTVSLESCRLADGTALHPSADAQVATGSGPHRLELVLQPRHPTPRIDGATAAGVLALLRREVSEAHAE